MTRITPHVIRQRILTGLLVTLSAALEAYTIRACVRPAHLLSSGFTGLSILINEIGSLFHVSIPVSVTYLLFNIPIALMCCRSISIRFTVFSSMQVVLCSLFINLFNVPALFDDILLSAIFGGVLYGFGSLAALKGGASTGGTDFIALYVSNKIGKTIWGWIFAFNCCQLFVFGFIFGWKYAAYSIILQFVSTKIIDTFHTRYNLSAVQITVKDPEPVIDAYKNNFRHGITVLRGEGGYSGETYYVLSTVTSSYEVRDVVRLVQTVDPKAIINVYKTERFYGSFFRKPIDE